mgnify:CR=1 FL=1
MKWDDLNYVLAIARGGSLSAAGRQLKVNPSTVARRLEALEERIGLPLFVRSREGFVSTEAGETVIAHAGRIENETLNLAEKLDLQDFSPQGPVRIATMPLIINTYLVPAVTDFRQLYPDIELELIGGVRDRNLSKREAEMALRFEIKPRNRERAFTLGSISYALYAPKNSDPSNLPWIAFGEDVAYSLPAQWTESARGKAGKVALRAHDTGFVHQAIRTGVGKGLIPEILGENDPGLVRLSGKEPEFERLLRVLVHEDTYKITRTRTVIEWLRGLPWINNA